MSAETTQQRPAAGRQDAPAIRASYREVLAVSEFRAVFAASIVSVLGSVVAAVALTVLIYEQTRSPALAASVMALSFLPYLFGGALLGAAADRLPARRVLTGCDMASAALVACMIIPRMPVPGLLALLFVNGIIAAVYQGVRSSVMPEILPPGPRYILGRSLMRLVAQSAQIVGYGTGGLLLAVLSPRGALAVDAACFAVSGLLVRLRMAARPALGTGSGSMARDSLAGLRGALAHRPTRRILLFIWLVPACAVAPEALAAPYAAHIGQPARVAGFLLMGIPAGTVVAEILAARLLSPRLQRRVIVPAALLGFAPLAAFALTPQLGPALGLLVISGLGSASFAGIDGVLLAAAPPLLRSRVLALSGSGLMFTQGAGFALWGIAGQYVPLPAVIAGAAFAGAAVVIALRPRQPTDARAHQPDARAHQPGARAHQPGARAHQPDARAHQPDARAHQPDGSGMPSV
jgi:Transmembrane secretion effector